MVSIIQLVLRWISNYSSLARTDLTLYFVCLFQNNMTYFYDSHGNASKAVGAYESSNGIVLKVDNVLSPPSLPAVNPKVSA